MSILQPADLQAFTSFGVPAPVAGLARFASADELEALLHSPEARAFGRQLLLLGGGSNMLFTQPYHGLVLKNEITGMQLLHEDAEYVYLRAGAGENWHQLVQYCIRHGYGGIENLSLIPGCVGAAPIQNIGAYGVELKDVFHSLEAWHLFDGAMQTFTHNDCQFGYRESVFKQQYAGQFAILNVTLRLHKHPRLHTSYGAIGAELERMGVQQPGIAEVSQAVINIRRSKLPDPAVLGNAGSFFKNPVVSSQQLQPLLQQYPTMPHYPAGHGQAKLAAGWLIEQCGLKGYRLGQAGVHQQQALVLVNHGGATGADVYQLSQHVQHTVQQRFGIWLEREVNVF
ncbi:MAG: UDP-N-acetylmuramate dehydrogenase [Chitinophagaceae bacterium]|nr:UDP-N-acetylmuramate dehydrogenase [Chitinophagaceae bacterium]